MSIKARIWWDEAAQAYVISSSFNEKLIEALKGLIPSGDRNYDPQTKFWYVKEQYGDAIRMIATSAFGMHAVSFTSRTVAQQAQQARQQFYNPIAANGTLDNAIVQFFNLISYDAAKQAYRRASLDLHPDKPSGDAQKMAKLNDLWSRIEKEFYKR